jgi:CDP-diglyceride synthetase
VFRQRLLTAVVLVPLVLLVIYYANLWLLGTVIGFLVLVGGWEWTQLIPIRSVVSKLFFIALLLLALYVSQSLFDGWLILGLVLWVGVLFSVLSFPASQKFWGNRWIVGISCLLLLPLFENTMAAIYQYPQGRTLIVYLLCLVWASDTGAYLAGKCWGRYKLIPKVSPGKTIEGSLGGLILAMFVAIIGYAYFKPSSLMGWYFTAAATSLISILGDLSISMLKRRSKLKDTGSIFPGHGGVLDRLDSLIAAAPLFYYGIQLTFG